MAKYDPLRDYLAGRGDNEVAMTFSDVEKLVGPLPASARIHRAWWANDTKVQAQAWRAAGRHVQSVNQAAEQVAFGYGAIGGNQPAEQEGKGQELDKPEVVARDVPRESSIGSGTAQPVPTPQQSLVARVTSKRWLPPLLAGFVTVAGTAVITVVGITSLPRSAIFLMALDISAVVTVITSALTNAKHRTALLWVSNALLIALVAGIAIYNINSRNSTENVVANTDVTLSSQAGQQPNPNDPNATVFSQGVGETATCYTTLKGAVWLYFHFSPYDYGWAPFSQFHYEVGFPQHLPANCNS